jgi:hypothetical protein
LSGRLRAKARSSRKRKAPVRLQAVPAPVKRRFGDRIKRPNAIFEKYIGRKNESSESYCLADRAQFHRADAFCDLNGGLRMRRVSTVVLFWCTSGIDDFALVVCIRRVW